MSKKNLLLVVIVLGVAVSVWYLEHMKVSPAGTGTGGAAQAINISFDAANVSVTSDASSSVTSSPSSPATASSLNTTQVREMLATISAQDKKAGYQPAIEIVGPTGFVNASSTFKLADLIGKKVILLDFWTYSCVNCVRTLPYLTSWYSKYKDQGLVIVGVHTPEFDFEKNIDNVRTAAKQYGIEYPIVLDSNYGTWNAYGNLYWPHEYLIDIAWYIVHDHIGEGSYDETEGLIQKLLAERATALGVSTSSIAKSDVNIKPADLNGIGSPETYFGSARNELLANGISPINMQRMPILVQRSSINMIRQKCILSAAACRREPFSTSYRMANRSVRRREPMSTTGKLRSREADCTALPITLAVRASIRSSLL